MKKTYLASTIAITSGIALLVSVNYLRSTSPPGVVMASPAAEPPRAVEPASTEVVAAGAPAQPTLAEGPRENSEAAADCCGRGIDPVGPVLAINHSPVVSPQEAQVFGRFNQWATDYENASDEARPAMVAAGAALARERREVMARLIEYNPREAIARADALSPLARVALPQAVAAHVETPVSAKGDLNVSGVLTNGEQTYRRTVTVGQDTYETYTYGKRNDPIPEQNASILGFSLNVQRAVGTAASPGLVRSDTLLALREERSRVLSNEEVVLAQQAQPAGTEHHCPVSGESTASQGDETALDVGGQIVWLCKNGHVGAWRKSPDGQLVEVPNAQSVGVAAAGGPGEGAGSFPSTSAGWNTGSKTLIGLPCRFPEQAANPFGTTNIGAAVSSAASRISTWSYGRISMTSFTTPVITLPHSEADYTASGHEDAMMADAIAAADSAGYNATGYNFRSLIFTGTLGNYCGLGQVVGKHSWIKCINANTIDHEVGHNLGLPHANSWDTDSSDPVGPGSHVEYGGYYNVMGGGSAAYDTMMRFYIRWLTYTEAYDLSTKANGTYRIYDPEIATLTSGRKYLIQIPKVGGQYYFVQFRPRATALADNGAVDAAQQNGITILRTDGSEQIDLTPGSANGMKDGALAVGQTFRDPLTGINISPTAKGGSGTDQYMDVSVTFDRPDIYPNGIHELVPQNATGTRLNVAGAVDADGTNVNMSNSNGTNAQRWRIAESGSGKIEFVPQCATGRRLDVTGAGATNGTDVDILADSDADQERWWFITQGSGVFKLAPKNATGLRLEVAGGGTGSGTNVDISSPTAGTYQQWKLVYIPLYNETESLIATATTNHRLIGSSSFSGGVGTILDATVIGDSVTYTVPSVSSGSYNVKVGVKKASSRGTFQLAIGSPTVNPVNLGATQDLYSASDSYVELDFGTWTPSSTSDKLFRFTITGKNGSSSGYSESFDYIKLTPL